MYKGSINLTFHRLLRGALLMLLLGTLLAGPSANGARQPSPEIGAAAVRGAAMAGTGSGQATATAAPKKKATSTPKATATPRSTPETPASGRLVDRRPNGRSEPEALPDAPFAAPPQSYYLEGISHEYQQLNNCGPVTTNMMLSYFGTNLSQAYTASKLKPHPQDVAVSSIEMVSLAEIEYGYGSAIGRGGNIKMLEALIANGIPVTVLQPLQENSDINHFRVVRGYNRKAGTITINDSYLGPNLVWSYGFFERMWAEQGEAYAMLYPKAKEAVVQTIIRRYSEDEEIRRDTRLQRTQQAVKETPNDPWAWLQLGATLYYREQYSESLAAWEKANALGLPEKALWYTAWPIGLHIEVGRYDEAVRLATNAISHTSGNAELYYERARAYDGMGNKALARENLEMATQFAPYHPVFREVLAAYD